MVLIKSPRIKFVINRKAVVSYIQILTVKIVLVSFHLLQVLYW